MTYRVEVTEPAEKDADMGSRATYFNRKKRLRQAGGDGLSLRLPLRSPHSSVDAAKAA